MDGGSDKIRFRCHGCDGLLRTVREKIGAIVICPRCSAEMIVPDPEVLSDSEGKTTEFPAAEEFPSYVGVGNPPTDTLAARWEARNAAARAAPSSAAAAATAEAADRTNSEEAIDLPIRFEPTAIRPETFSRSTTRDRDLLIPRDAFLAWALFGVLALGLSFVAGLLAGRFLWTTYP